MDSNGTDTSVDALSLSVNEHETGLAYESADVGDIDAKAANDPERGADMIIVGRRS